MARKDGSDLIGLCEYVNIKDITPLMDMLYKRVDENEVNTFGKTAFKSYSLEHTNGSDTGYTETFKEILDIHRQVHPDMQRRSTGFNTSNHVKKDLFAHTDVDYDQEHPNYYNLIIPLHGLATLHYYETNEDEIVLGEMNAHGNGYYHEFRNRLDPDNYQSFLAERRIGSITMDKPLLLTTNTMHSVSIDIAPRVAWCTRWINIPGDIDFYTFKDRVERIL